MSTLGSADPNPSQKAGLAAVVLIARYFAPLVGPGAFRLGGRDLLPAGSQFPRDRIEPGHRGGGAGEPPGWAPSHTPFRANQGTEAPAAPGGPSIPAG